MSECVCVCVCVCVCESVCVPACVHAIKSLKAVGSSKADVKQE